jgi:hypothetical protein
MDPLLVSGDQVKLAPMTCLVKGRLYLFELPDGSFAVHRLIECKNQEVTMKGDRSKGFERAASHDLIAEVSEVKLSCATSWIPMKSNCFMRRLFTYLSKKTIKDRQTYASEGLYRKITRKVCAPLLVFISKALRRYWRLRG